MTSSAVMIGWRPTARACNSSWSSNIARPSWAFILLLPLLWLVIPSLSLEYEVAMSLVKWASVPAHLGYKGNGRDRRTVSVLGGAAAAANRTEGQAGAGQEQQTAQQDRPNRQRQEQGVVEIVLGEPEERHDQDRDHAERGSAQKRAQLDVRCRGQAGAIRRRHQAGSHAKGDQGKEREPRRDREDHCDHDDGGDLVRAQPAEQVHPVER